MKEYLLLLRGGDAKMSEFSETEAAEHMAQWGKYMGSIAEKGQLVGGLPLSKEGRLMCNKGVQEGVATLENGQSIGGWLHFKAANFDEAIALAKECPIFETDGNIEIREVLPMEM